MKQITTTVYAFDELDDKAKEKARDWYRIHALDYEWWDSTYEDAERIGVKITSFDLGRGNTISGELTGTVLESIEEIFDNHGETCQTYSTAKRYEPVARDIAKRLDSDEGASDDEIENLEQEYLHDILEDYLVMLRHEYEYLMSDESVDENIQANEYTFTEDGKREG